jgi:WAS/WASL-interacting protein
MRLTKRPPRSGFSLLEMVLALALGMLLLLGVYVAFSTYITYAQAGRDAAAEGALMRNLVMRLTHDITGQVGAQDPRVNSYPWAQSADSSSSPSSSSNPSGSSSNPSGSSSQNPGSTTPSTKSGSASKSSSSSQNSSSSTQTTDPSTYAHYNVGVNGKAAGVLILSNNRVRQGPTFPDTTNTDDVKDPTNGITSDAVLTVYWIVMNGNDSAGLARAEFRQATSTNIDPTSFDPTTLPNQKDYIIAPEVKSIVFEYYDGTAWQTYWDGTSTPTTDGSTPPHGPPAAIRVTITLKATATAADGSAQDGPTYQSVIPIPAANNFPTTSSS